MTDAAAFEADSARLGSALRSSPEASSRSGASCPAPSGAHPLAPDLVRETLGMPLPPRQDTSLRVVRALIAYGGLLYITPELQHLLERPANLPIASPFLSYLRVLRPGRYLKRWGRRLTEEGLSHEDALILSYASFGFDALEKTFGVECVLTNDLRMNNRYTHGFPRIEARFARMIRQLKAPYQQATLPDVVSAEELRAQMAL